MRHRHRYCARARGRNVTGVDLGQPENGTLASEHLLFGQDATDLPAELRNGIGALLLFDVIEAHRGRARLPAPSSLGVPQGAACGDHRTCPQGLWTTFDDHFGHFRRWLTARCSGRNWARTSGTGPPSPIFSMACPAILLNNLLRGGERDLRFVPPPRRALLTLNKSLAALFALEARLLPGPARLFAHRSRASGNSANLTEPERSPCAASMASRLGHIASSRASPC